MADLLCTVRQVDALAVADQALAPALPGDRERLRATIARYIARRSDPRGTRRGARLLGLATLFRLDLASPELRIAVEHGGYAAHYGREAVDEARRGDVRRRGWIMVVARTPARLALVLTPTRAGVGPGSRGRRPYRLLRLGRLRRAAT